MKVAIIDIIRVLDQTKRGLAGAKQLEGLFNEQQRELAPLIQQVKNKRDPKIEKQLETRAKEHEQAREKMRVELREALLQQARAVMDEVAKKQGVDFVLARPQAMMWAKPELDITDAVVVALDALPA
ncbi:MAG: OmpH family outer membrane protein [Deltaproteobacteria bacterium]|nr:OmpH family outer membrane protein [Deltaproteobacteria bacterium]